MKSLKLAETKKIKETINELGRKGTPFLFIIDYKIENSIIIPLTDIHDNEILYQLTMDDYQIQNFKSLSKKLEKKIFFDKKPVDFSVYEKSFHKIYPYFLNGNTYLTNLTFPTSIDCNLRLEEIFFYSKAPYKLLVKDQFVVFSPETFIRINRGTISSYPMKGTIDAKIKNAAQKIINNEKELAEHITIVDLIRNDLNLVAQNVRVEEFRTLSKIEALGKELLQVSSKITGELPENYRECLGDILLALLPAGSICGAPKKKTLEIIEEAENYERGYYTGVFGIFDGNNLESAVLIRFIEKTENGLIYKSGGGITYDSDIKSEYDEMVDKIYVPIV